MKKIILFTLLLLTLTLSAQTFTRNLGTEIVNDGATCIAKSNAGFFISGYSDDIAYLSEIDENGEELWRDYYNFTEQLDFITYIAQSNNKIIGCGYGYSEGSASFLEFYFKYDVASKSFDWVKRNIFNLKPSKIEPLPNGNYLLTGDQYGQAGFNLFLMELNVSTGKSERYTNWAFSGNESSSSSIIYDNHIYSGGRYGLQKKIDKYRGAISKFDLKFNEVWSNYYLNYKDKFLRNYLSKLIIDDGNIISLYFTNNHGINSYYTASLAKQDLDGEMIWATEFELEGIKNLTVKDIKPVADGYLIYGFTKSPTEKLFIIKTDKEGISLWAKTYGGRFNDNLPIDQGNFIEIKNNYIYSIGQSINISDGTDYDAFLMKLNLDGSSDDNCWEEDIEVKTTRYLDLIKGEIFLTRQDSTVRSFNLGYKKQNFTATVNNPYVCFPKLATNDKDTILQENEIAINFLKNDIIPKNEIVDFKLLTMPKQGTAIIKSRKIIYTRTNQSFCGIDSFDYLLVSELNGFDTATVYVYSIDTNLNLESFKDEILPEKGSIVLNAEMPGANYLWSTGETSSSIKVNTSGKYTVNITKNGCLSSQSILVEENPYSFKDVATNNISFMLDVSLSMNRDNRLPILKNSLYKIMNFMRQEDKISVINYSSDAEIIFDGVDATKIDEIKSKIESINSAGNSNIIQGVKLAIKTTENNYTGGGNNRIIFTTDGDVSNEKRLEMIDYMKKSFPEDTYFSIFLFNDASIFKTQMQSVADAVNGQLYVITPENVEQILLRELKAVKN